MMNWQVQLCGSVNFPLLVRGSAYPKLERVEWDPASVQRSRLMARAIPKTEGEQAKTEGEQAKTEGEQIMGFGSF